LFDAIRFFALSPAFENRVFEKDFGSGSAGSDTMKPNMKMKNMKMNLSRQQLSLLATVLIAIFLFVAASWRYVGFASASVFINLIDDNAFLGIAAIGMTFVILSGGIDLSVGAVIGLTSILSALLIQKFQISPFVVIPAVIFLGAIFGGLMGLLIALFDLAPFLVTLAGMFFARGLAYTLSLDSIPLTHPLFAWISQTRLNLGLISLPLIAMIFLAVVAAGIWISTQTRFGRAVYAIGGNSASARLMGLSVERNQVLIYAFSGGMAALAGIVYTFYTSSGNATAAMGLELDAIAAVVIGGTLLSGGTGTVFGTLIGTLILGMIQTIITFESTLSSWWTKIVIGSLLFFFVVLQKLLAKIGHRSLPGPRAHNPSSSQPSNSQAGRTSGRDTLGKAMVFILSCGVALGISQKAEAGKLKPLNKIECPAGQQGGAMIAEGLYQMTGTHLKQGQTVHVISEIPDPAPPYVAADGSVEIFGSTQYLIRYKNWEQYAQGGCYEIVPLNLVSNTGFGYSEIYTQPWDLRKYRIERKNQKASELLIGGAMTASKGRPIPYWPEDNLNRRIFFFRLDSLNRWARDLSAIIGEVADNWMGHSYGGNLIQENSSTPNTIQADGSGAIGFFFEKVSEVRNGNPYKTEIFAVKMKNFDLADPASEVKIFEIGAKPYPATERVGNGYLVEGPRPFQVNFGGKAIYLVGFSSGDFPTDHYHINYMWSSQLMGPYKAVLTEDGQDLLDLGKSLKSKYGLSWVGRPSLYQTPDGGYEMLFHGVIKSILPENDYTRWPNRYQLWEFFRCIFKVRIQISEKPNGEPVIELLAR
jgi:ribose/xylose/arabinose/galactoside ABC-type transport system permease subunit